MPEHRVDLDIPLEDLDAFEAQMESINRTAQTVSRTLAGGLKSALVDGKSLDTVLRQVALTASSRVLNSALAPLERLAGDAVGSILPFAKGGVVSSPQLFGAQGTLGLMGEAGPEAIMPLARGADGRLGVRAGPGAQGAVPAVQVNISARDVESFRRSEAQVSAIVARAVGRGRRGL